jgi:dethiobiotin synthetase
MKLFITGIGTGIGKTVVSAIVAEALRADYWKPVQAGNLDDSDTLKVRQLVSCTDVRFFEEVYRLKEAMSPHAAAELEGVELSVSAVCSEFSRLPSENLIIEGAGGVLVPLSRKELVIDLIMRLETPVILVIRNYLGSINHSLLTFEALRNRNIPIKGIVFNGQSNPSSESIILEHTGLPCLLRIGNEERIDRELIRAYAKQFKLV